MSNDKDKIRSFLLRLVWPRCLGLRFGKHTKNDKTEYKIALRLSAVDFGFTIKWFKNKVKLIHKNKNWVPCWTRPIDFVSLYKFENINPWTFCFETFKVFSSLGKTWSIFTKHCKEELFTHLVVVKMPTECTIRMVIEALTPPVFLLRHH